MLDVDRLIVSAKRRVLRTPERLLKFLCKTGWATHEWLAFFGKSFLNLTTFCWPTTAKAACRRTTIFWFGPSLRIC
jgi:hypothetical protein